MDSEESEHYSHSQTYPYIDSSAGNEVCVDRNPRFCVTSFLCHANWDVKLFSSMAPTPHGLNSGAVVSSDYAQVRPPELLPLLPFLSRNARAENLSTVLFLSTLVVSKSSLSKYVLITGVSEPKRRRFDIREFPREPCCNVNYMCFRFTEYPRRSSRRPESRSLFRTLFKQHSIQRVH